MIVSTSDAVEQLALEAYRQGARAYLLEAHSMPSEIIEAIHALNRGKSVLHPQVAG
jgi:DNA-binding NarL/FixJ family response regulator